MEKKEQKPSNCYCCLTELKFSNTIYCERCKKLSYYEQEHLHALNKIAVVLEIIDDDISDLQLG